MLHWYLGLCAVVLKVVGLSLDSLSLFVFSHRRMRASGVHRIFAFFTCAQILTILTTLPPDCVTVASRINYPYLPKWSAFYMVYVRPLAYIGHSISVWSLCFVSMQQLISLRWQVAARFFNVGHRAEIICCMIFCLSIVYNVVRFFDFKLILCNDDYQLAVVNTTINNSTAYGRLCVAPYFLANKTYITTVLIAGTLLLFAMPLTIFSMTSLFSITAMVKAKRIINQLTMKQKYNHVQTKRARSSSNLSLRLRREELKLTILCLVMTGSFLACFAPFPLNHLAYYFRWLDKTTLQYTNRIGDLLMTLHTFSTWFIYCFWSTKYRKTVQSYYVEFKYKLNIEPKSQTSTSRKRVRFLMDEQL